jgi:amidohydrolase
MDRNKFYRIREELHRHPELSGQEKHTIQYIRQVLQEFQPSRIHPLEKGHGLVAEYSFPGEGPTLLFRADIDAVAIAEKSPLPYCSENPGVAHKCGHDGHTTMLLMLAGLLHEHPLERGRILLLFQPAEENGQGAQLVLQDPWFRQQKIDRAFALHNLPGYPFSTIVCRTGSFTCSVISCTITFTGKTAHAAEPEKAVSPTAPLLHILHLSESWNRGTLKNPDYFRTTLIELHIGEEAYGVAAGSGLIRLTLRAASEKILQKHRQQLEQFVQQTIDSHPALLCSIEWTEPFAANENDPESVTWIQEAAQSNGLVYEETDHPFAWGEDFGLFTQHIPGAMFGLGAGISTPALHTPDYDFPNNILQNGARMFYELALITQLSE